MEMLENAYAILIGVGNDLPNSTKDAIALNELLIDKNIAGYPSENITILTEEDAVRGKILKAFDNLIAKTDEDSSIVLFYSGHGGTDGSTQFFIQPFDMTADNYESTWVKAEELQEKISQLKSRRLIFFLDCCHAAGVSKSVTNESALENRIGELNQADGLAQKIDDGRGMSIISSCRADERSWSAEEHDNSIFTKCLLEVLKGEHKLNFNEPFIRMSEVIKYLFKKVPEWVDIQHPYANLQMYDDFILSRVPEKLRLSISSDVYSSKLNSRSKESTDIVTSFKEEKDANNLLIFLHGFSGEASNTFGKIPILIGEDPEMKGWDIAPFGYSQNVNPDLGKNIWASVDDITRISDYLATSIKFKFGKYDRIAIVAHSLGGLVAQRAILNLDKPELDKISHLLLFATPSNGVGKENDLAKNRKFIKTLRNDWNNSFRDTVEFKFSTVAGTDDEIVTIDSSLKCFDDNYAVTMAGDHFSLVNPPIKKDIKTGEEFPKDNDTYHFILSSLTDNEFTNKYTNDAEINFLLGEYNAVINDLLPKVKELDKKSLSKLIFALEGSDRGKEALEILESHELLDKYSDLLGVLGGRHKRKYLITNKLKDGEEAIKYYSKGLEIAQNKKDDNQIYYHAINLAFMNIKLHDDRSEMRSFAQLALKSIENDPFPDMWKSATIAEAKMYLGNFDIAKEHYSKAAEKASIREKISIHLNASAGYSYLMDTSDENDDFLKFLKFNFLS